jgi:hypothetical protein
MTSLDRVQVAFIKGSRDLAIHSSGRVDSNIQEYYPCSGGSSLFVICEVVLSDAD